MIVSPPGFGRNSHSRWFRLLTSTENRIAFARQFYNDEVMKFNAAQATFPRNLFAGIFGFSPATMFAAEETERANVAEKTWRAVG
jgi:LemA protein